MARYGRIIALVVVCIAIYFAAPFLGGERLVWDELRQPGSPSYRILFELRLPRLLVALVTGGALAMLGGTYQILFHNPLAEPYILGVASAVTLGIAISELFFHFPPFSYWGAIGGGLAALAITGLMIRLGSGRGEGLSRIVLFGMGVNFLLSSILFLLLTYVQQMMGGSSWRYIFGQIPWVTGYEALVYTALCLPLLAALFVWGRTLDALSLGDTVARTLGVSPGRARAGLLLLTSAIVAVLVALTGAIGFVGLVIPHGTRLVFRPSTTRRLFALSAAIGAAFLVLCDVLARSIIPPLEFPIGILTTLVGGPIFLYLLWRRR